MYGEEHSSASYRTPSRWRHHPRRATRKHPTLSRAIATCQAQEAAKKNRADMTIYTMDSVRVLNSTRYDQGDSSPPCPGCGAKHHSGGRRQCPAYRQACFIRHKTGHFAKVCHGRQEHQPWIAWPSKERGAPWVRTSIVRVTTILNPAPSVVIHVTSPNGSATVTALPDLGTDIAAAGAEVLALLGKHQLNLLPSQTTPLATNGSSMLFLMSRQKAIYAFSSG